MWEEAWGTGEERRPTPNSESQELIQGGKEPDKDPAGTRSKEQEGESRGPRRKWIPAIWRGGLLFKVKE